MKLCKNQTLGSKCIRIVISVLLWSSLFQLPSNAETLRYALINPVVNVRNATSTKGDVVYVIETPGEYLILQESKDAEGKIWYKIQISEDLNGFVASWVVDSVRTAEKETPIEGMVVVIEPGVKIRTRPSLHASIHYITRDQEVKTTVNGTKFKLKDNSMPGLQAGWFKPKRQPQNKKVQPIS